MPDSSFFFFFFFLVAIVKTVMYHFFLKKATWIPQILASLKMHSGVGNVLCAFQNPPFFPIGTPVSLIIQCPLTDFFQVSLIKSILKMPGSVILSLPVFFSTVLYSMFPCVSCKFLFLLLDDDLISTCVSLLLLVLIALTCVALPSCFKQYLSSFVCVVGTSVYILDVKWMAK